MQSKMGPIKGPNTVAGISIKFAEQKSSEGHWYAVPGTGTAAAAALHCPLVTMVLNSSRMGGLILAKWEDCSSQFTKLEFRISSYCSHVYSD